MDNVKELATSCGAKTLHCRATVDDRMLLHAQQAVVVEEHVYRQLARTLADEIVANAGAASVVIQRKSLPHPYTPGVTEYRMSVVAFSEDGLQAFAEKLLNTYGDQYAKAALETKKKSLKNKLTAAVDAA